MIDEALYRATYNSDPDDETLATFFGMLQRIPDQIKAMWRPTTKSGLDGIIERAEREGLALHRLENISD